MNIRTVILCILLAIGNHPTIAMNALEYEKSALRDTLKEALQNNIPILASRWLLDTARS